MSSTPTSAEGPLSPALPRWYSRVWKMFVSINLPVVFGVLGVATILLPLPGCGPTALPLESDFYMGIDRSLYHLDEAKARWREKYDKKDEDIPTVEELLPFSPGLAEAIQHFRSLGIVYQTTSSETNQSDVATLTRDLRFVGAFCHYYPAGKGFRIQGPVKAPTYGLGTRLKAIYFNTWYLLAPLCFLLAGASWVASQLASRWTAKRRSPPNT